MNHPETISDRLSEYIGDEPGARLSIRQFAKAMQEHEPRPAGSSRAMIHRYLKGAEKQPPTDFVTAAAAILGVRPAWLAFGDGQPTSTHVVITTMTATAPTQIIGTPTGAEATVRRISQIAPELTRFPAGHALFVDAWDRLVRSSVRELSAERQFTLAAEMWRIVTAPLDLIGVSKADAPAAFYVAAFGAIIAATPEQGKGKDLHRVPRKTSTTAKRSK